MTRVLLHQLFLCVGVLVCVRFSFFFSFPALSQVRFKDENQIQASARKSSSLLTLTRRRRRDECFRDKEKINGQKAPLASHSFCQRAIGGKDELTKVTSPAVGARKQRIYCRRTRHGRRAA